MNPKVKLCLLGINMFLLAGCPLDSATTPLGAPVATVAARTLGTAPAVTLYADAEHMGTAQELREGWYGLTQLFGNDKVSSVRVAPGFRVTLFADAGFKGATEVITGERQSLPNFNDKTSSVWVERVDPVDGDAIQVSGWEDSDKNWLLWKFAPRIWLAKGEQYFPSSVEWNSSFVIREWRASEGRYCLRTREAMSSPSVKLEYFKGNLSSAQAYAFLVEKSHDNLDLVYFVFYPYNRGKDVMNTNFGNHVGDWEHVTVRLQQFEKDGMKFVKPISVYFPAHDFGTAYPWGGVEKVDGTHPVAYSASGSHGHWKSAGSYVYKNLSILGKLTDDCSAGTAWDTWNSMRMFQYSTEWGTGRALWGDYPGWLNKDYWDANGQASYRWGNAKWGEVFGQARLSDGPTGPQEKTALSDYWHLY